MDRPQPPAGQSVADLARELGWPAETTRWWTDRMSAAGELPAVRVQTPTGRRWGVPEADVPRVLARLRELRGAAPTWEERSAMGHEARRRAPRRERRKRPPRPLDPDNPTVEV